MCSYILFIQGLTMIAKSNKEHLNKLYAPMPLLNPPDMQFIWTLHNSLLAQWVVQVVQQQCAVRLKCLAYTAHN